MFDRAAEIIALIVGKPPDQPALVVDRVKRQAALQTRVHQEFRMPGPPRRQAVPQAVPPPPACSRVVDVLCHSIPAVALGGSHVRHPRPN